MANVTAAAVTSRATTGARAPRNRLASPQRLRYDTSCDGPPGRHPPAPGRIAERHAAGHDPALAVGHAQDVEGLAGMEEAEHARQRAADAVGAGGEHGAPHRRVDRAARRVVLDEREQEQRHLLEVVGQPLGRPLHLDHLDALGVVGIGLGRGEALGVDRDPELGDAVLVERADGVLVSWSSTSRKRQFWVLPPLGARMAASRMRPARPRGRGRGGLGAWPASCTGLRGCPSPVVAVGWSVPRAPTPARKCAPTTCGDGRLAP